MGVARMLLLLLLTFSALSSIQARSHYYHHHHHHNYHHNTPTRSIALPPDADPPIEAPEPPNATTLPPGSYGNSTNSTSVPISTPNAPPPNAGSYGNSTNSTSISSPPVQPPPGSYGNSTNSTSVPISTPNAPPPNAGSYGNSTNSTNISPPPVQPPTGSYGNSTNSTSVPISTPNAPPPNAGSYGNSTNSTSISPPAQPPLGSYGNSTNSTSVPISTPNAPPPNSGSYGNSSNSTSISPPPVQPPLGSYGNSTNSTSVPISTPNAPPPNAGSYGNSTNSTSISSPPASPPMPNLTSVFDVRSFGAVGDGVTDDTEAFKSAWISACDDSAGVVLAPQGYSFMIRSTIFTGPCKNGVVFQIDGIVMAPDGPDSWPQSNSRRHWLIFYRADGLSLQGTGLIDGRGQKWWDLPCKPHKGINGTTEPGPCDSPVALRFFQSSNLSVHGLKIKNSPQFHFRFDNCKNVIVDSISINSSALSPNTDGIHVENTNTVGIYNSIISSGDDCISIGSGSLNVDIQNVTCGPSHGISIGSLGKQNSRACVANITVQNTIIKHSDNGVRIKTWQGGSGSVSSISFANILMDTVRNPIMNINPIIIDQYYCLSKGCDNQTSAVYVSDIQYSNIRGTYDVRSPPIHFGCSDSVPCTNITLTDVELFPAQGEIISDPFCWNIYGISQTLTIPPVSCLLEGLPRRIMDIDADKCY